MIAFGDLAPGEAKHIEFAASSIQAGNLPAFLSLAEAQAPAFGGARRREVAFTHKAKMQPAQQTDDEVKDLITVREDCVAKVGDQNRQALRDCMQASGLFD